MKLGVHAKSRLGTAPPESQAEMWGWELWCLLSCVGGEHGLPSALCWVGKVPRCLWSPGAMEGWKAACCPDSLRKGASLRKNFTLNDGKIISCTFWTQGLCWSWAASMSGRGFNCGRPDETGDGQRGLILLPRGGLLPEWQPEYPPPVGRASVRACLLLGTRKSHHELQSQGSLHVFPTARRAIYIWVINVACKLRTDLLFFSHTVSSSYWGDAGTCGESHAAGSWRKKNLCAELVHS